MKYIHDSTSVDDSATVARFQCKCDTISTRNHIFKYGMRSINDFLDLIIRITLKVIRIVALTFAVNKIVEVYIKENIAIVTGGHKFLELIKIPKFIHVVFITVLIDKSTFLIARCVL